MFVFGLFFSSLLGQFLAKPAHHLPDMREKEQECTAGGGGGTCHTTDLDQLKMLLNCTLEGDSQPSFSV